MAIRTFAFRDGSRVAQRQTWAAGKSPNYTWSFVDFAGKIHRNGDFPISWGIADFLVGFIILYWTFFFFSIDTIPPWSSIYWDNTIDICGLWLGRWRQVQSTDFSICGKLRPHIFFKEAAAFCEGDSTFHPSTGLMFGTFWTWIAFEIWMQPLNLKVKSF